ncbi:hypothetical protein [Oceanobacillus sp. CF4.6]|uniref:hypothetical protein n=1 Tax=Oceanobacillus sp. CF4.6 TaxID=3373080 RepID=UPI003EE79365
MNLKKPIEEQVDDHIVNRIEALKNRLKESGGKDDSLLKERLSIYLEIAGGERV